MARLGRYEVLEEIGAGAMGTVFRALDTMLDREVALKVIRTGPAVEPDVLERFYREARACARLHHPCIVQVYDLGEADQKAYIAMELLRGLDFRQIIQRKAELPIQNKLELMIQICDALNYAHGQGIVHRDIKPSNLYALPDHRAKILDFGIARLPSSRLTRAGIVLGTPNYMAPEQVRGAPSDARSDLFSAALVFFELLVYVHPFRADTIARRIATGEPEKLSDHAPDMPGILERVFDRAFAKDVNERYASGSDLANDLRKVLDLTIFGSSWSTAASRSEDVNPVESLPQPAVADVNDLSEQNRAHALQLVREFDEALQSQEEAAAREKLRQLEELASRDLRFKEPVENCRTKLNQVTSPSSMPHGSSGAGQTAETCPYCHALNRPEAAFCIDCGAVIVHHQPDSSVVSPETAQDLIPDDPAREPETPLLADQAVAESPPRSLHAAPVHRKDRTGKLLTVKQWLFAGGAALFVFLTLVIFGRRAGVPMESAWIATASVIDSGAGISSRPGASTDAQLKGGTPVHILEIPDRKLGTVRVQPVENGKPREPGYVAVRHLTNWEGTTAQNALAIARVIEPGEQGNTQELEAQIGELRKMAKKFPAEQSALEAQIDIARLELALAQRGKAAREPRDAWMSHVDLATAALDAARSSQALQPLTESLRAAADLLRATPEDTPPPGGTPAPDAEPAPEESVSSMLRRSERLLAAGRYDDAERTVGRILKKEPVNAHAKRLFDLIQKHREAEALLGR